MCGMCLPHCPTYRVYGHEAESPRGRIAIIQAYLQGRLEPDAIMIEHLDHCLGCLACEAICPSRVPYGELIDYARAQLQSQVKTSDIQARLLKATEKAGGIASYNKLFRLHQKPVARQIINAGLKLSGNSKLVRLINQADPAQFDEFYPAQAKQLGKVALFSGCMGNSFDGEALTSAIKLLNIAGFDVHVPKQQHCCGALHQHTGHPQTATELASRNMAMFNQLDVDYLLFTSSACGAQLKQPQFTMPVMDIGSFILEHALIPDEKLQPLDNSILLHESCSSRNRLKITGTSKALVTQIPQLNCIEFTSAQLCCGAGSQHQLSHEDLASQLLAIKLEEISTHKPRYLVSDNLGCSMHFRSGLAEHQMDLEVIHPITLLARQLK